MKSDCFGNSSSVLTSRVPLCLSVLLTGCAGLHVDLRPQAAMDPVLDAPLEVAWSYNARAGFGPDAPQSFGEYILISTRQGEVHVIEAATGRRVGAKRFGDAVNGAPVVVDRVLVVPVAAGRSSLVAYNLSRAQVIWRRRGPPIHTGLAAVEEDVILVNTDGVVERVRAADGELVWSHALTDAPRVYARPIVLPDRVIIVDEHGRAVALDPDRGTVIWEHHVGGQVYTAPASGDGRLAVPTTRGQLSVLDLNTGERLWQFALPDSTVRMATPAVNEKVVVAGASDGFLRKWDAISGALEWVFDGGEALTAAPVLTDSFAYAGSMGRRLLAVRMADGTLAQEIELRGRIKSSMTLQPDGLIVLTEPRYVVRLKEADGV